jgi:hypothetical protein
MNSGIVNQKLGEQSRHAFFEIASLSQKRGAPKIAMDTGIFEADSSQAGTAANCELYH